MNSIRPLVTITILVVVGAYLYVKINEGPAQPADLEEWQNETLDDVPPLDTLAATATAETGAAPAWGGGPAAAAVPIDGMAQNSGANATAPATADVSTDPGAAPGALPAVPTIPELPVPTGQGEYGPLGPSPSVPIPNELPQNIPVAQYPDGPAAGVASNPYPSTGAEGAPQNQIAPGQTADITPDIASSTVPIVRPDASQQSPLSENPLRQSATPTASADQYPTSSTFAQTQTPATAPAAASFAASLPAIQLALERRELARALELLTPWHNDPTLAPTDAKKVEALLGQLAGTVVYSTEHQLEPAHVVKSGETLETIAKEYNVPWRLLAKINGIAAADQVRPGQELKVVRGPFSAVIDLNRKELTLSVNGHYAGKFAAETSSSVPVSEGEWVVRGNSESPRCVFLARRDAAASLTLSETIVLGPVKTFEQLGVSAAMVDLSKEDTNEVADILSVGSRVVIRR
jgi:LysM repeat protein